MLFFKKHSAPDAVTTGLVAGVETTPASLGLTSGAPAPEAKPPVNMDDVRRMLKRKMDAVLKTRAELARVQSSCQAAVLGVLVVRGADWPPTLDEAAVLNFIERSLSLCREAAQADHLYRQATIALRDAQLPALAARGDLLAACTQVAEQSPDGAELSDDVYVAARALSAVDDLSQPDYAFIVRNSGYTEEAAPAVDLNWGDLRWLLVRTVTAAVEGLSLLDRHKLALEAMAAVAVPKVVLPKRPSPEEQQRFLRQVDSFMRKRRQTHADFVSLNASVDAHAAKLLSAINDADLRIDKLASACCSMQTDLQVEVAFLLLKRVRQKAENIHKELLRRGCVSTVDSVHRAQATAEEEVAIKRLQEQMRLAADVASRFNDATNALCHSSSDLYNHKQVSYADVSETGSWDALRQWWRDKQQEQRRADRDNLIMDTKHALLEEAVDHYWRRVKRQAIEMRVAVLRNLPGSDKPPPCDELRILLNSVAWTQGRIVSEFVSIYTSYRSGSYPLY